MCALGLLQCNHLISTMHYQGCKGVRKAYSARALPASQHKPARQMTQIRRKRFPSDLEKLLRVIAEDLNYVMRLEETNLILSYVTIEQMLALIV